MRLGNSNGYELDLITVRPANTIAGTGDKSKVKFTSTYLSVQSTSSSSCVNRYLCFDGSNNRGIYAFQKRTTDAKDWLYSYLITDSSVDGALYRRDSTTVGASWTKIAVSSTKLSNYIQQFAVYKWSGYLADDVYMNVAGFARPITWSTTIMATQSSYSLKTDTLKSDTEFVESVLQKAFSSGLSRDEWVTPK